MENKYAPNLRFQNFNGPWTPVKLGKATIKTSLKNKENVSYPIYSISNKSGFNPQGEQFEGLDSEARGYDISMYKIIQKNTFAYNPARINVGSIGYSGELENIIISSLYVCFRTIESINDSFLLIYLKSDRFLKDVKRQVEGGVRDYLFYDNFSSISICIPSYDEQKMISAFLTDVEQKIQSLNRKKELLQDLKKGMIQKLFSQEVRFKDEKGDDFPDWEERKVGDFLVESRIKGSNGLEAKKITVKLWGKGVFEKHEVREGSEQTNYFERRAGQFIYSKLDFLNCAFGLVPKSLDGYESTVDLPCFDISNNLNPHFLLERVRMKNFYEKLGGTADGSRKAKRIHSEVFLSFPLDCPVVEEQTKIANFLSAIDQKIEVVNSQLTKAETWKKGLLQQMFV